jgi:hypothetical protein
MLSLIGTVPAGQNVIAVIRAIIEVQLKLSSLHEQFGRP